jgi:hypothetical protein
MAGTETERPDGCPPAPAAYVPSARRGPRDVRRLTGAEGWLTEGFDTSDLREAKTLLEELA